MSRESTGIAGLPEAYFRRQDGPQWAARWKITDAAAHRPWPDPSGPDLALLERAFGRTRFVFLRRDDIVAPLRLRGHRPLCP